jgi:hypothetical protein
VTGGTLVVLTGTGFTAGLNVQFGGSVAPPITVIIVNSTTIHVLTPPHSEGQVDVRLLWGPSTVAMLPQAFRYIAAGLPKVLQVAAAPNPLNASGGAVYVLMDGAADELVLGLHTSGLTLAAQIRQTGVERGWNSMALDADALAGLANGLYYYRVTSWVAGVEKHKGLTGRLFLLR